MDTNKATSRSAIKHSELNVLEARRLKYRNIKLCQKGRFVYAIVTRIFKYIKVLLLTLLRPAYYKG